MSISGLRMAYKHHCHALATAAITLARSAVSSNAFDTESSGCKTLKKCYSIQLRTAKLESVCCRRRGNGSSDAAAGKTLQNVKQLCWRHGFDTGGGTLDSNKSFTYFDSSAY